MKQQDTLVSVVMTAYNAGAYIAKALESLRHQSYNNLEIIVVDDNSKDETYAILKRFKKKDSRIKLFRNKKRYGPAVSFNRAMRRAKGMFVTFMNPLDINKPERIKKQVNFLKKNPKVVAVGSQCTFITEADKRIGRSEYPHHHDHIYQTLLHGIAMKYETVMINRWLLPKDILKFTTNAYPYIYSEVFMKILQYGKLANLKEYLYLHRKAEHKTFGKLGKSDRMLSFTKLLVKSVTEHDYRPSVKAFLSPFLTPVKTVFR